MLWYRNSVRIMRETSHLQAMSDTVYVLNPTKGTLYESTCSTWHHHVQPGSGSAPEELLVTLLA